MDRVKNIAVLLTCFNRIKKTNECLSSFISAVENFHHYNFSIYVVDDHSSDGTAEMIKEIYPTVNLIMGDGSLFWAGGMRMAWRTALNADKDFDGFLLINDDVFFFDSFWTKIEVTIKYVESNFKKQGVYVLSTIDRDTQTLSYGGYILNNRLFKHSYYLKSPDNQPAECDLTNANILYVAHEVVDEIGILDERFTHSLADFDYALTAKETGFPVLVCPGIGGYCINDHPDDVLSSKIPIRNRIENLYSIKGVALNEYLYYLNKHFRFKAPYAFIVLWLRTLFPKIIPV